MTNHLAFPAIGQPTRSIGQPFPAARHGRRGSRHRRRVGGRARVLVAATVFVMTVGSTVTIASAPALAHGRGANGCTGVPDSGYAFDFHIICDRHDRCYGTRSYGSGYHGRRSCDRAFRAAMLSHCGRHRRYTVKRLTCRSTAWAYYYGVRALGGPAWSRRSSPPVG